MNLQNTLRIKLLPDTTHLKQIQSKHFNASQKSNIYNLLTLQLYNRLYRNITLEVELHIKKTIADESTK